MPRMGTGCGLEQAATAFRIHTLMKLSTLFAQTAWYQGKCLEKFGVKHLVESWVTRYF